MPATHLRNARTPLRRQAFFMRLRIAPIETYIACDGVLATAQEACKHIDTMTFSDAEAILFSVVQQAHVSVSLLMLARCEEDDGSCPAWFRMQPEDFSAQTWYPWRMCQYVC